MVLESNLPPVSFQSVVDHQWYIITTKEWIKVDRKYSWDEIKPMWQPIVRKVVEQKTTKPLNISKRTYKVEGSKGNVYDVKYDSGRWSCTCPAFGWSRGKECKHIKSIRTK
jgi:hypothetical protein